MKRLLLCVGLLCAAALSSGSAPSISNAASAAKTERAVTRFDQPVILMGETLKGDYLFVHDEQAMARGEACSYVYKGNSEALENLVVAFHCTPKERAKATRFTTRSVQTAPGRVELTEFQFPGSTEGHLVPVPKH